MADAPPGGIGGHAVGLGELRDGLVLGLVVLAQILDVVVEREHGLLRVLHPGHAQTLEFAHDRAGVVVGHDVVGYQGDVIPAMDFLAGVEADGVGLHDFFDDGLGHGGIPLSGREGGKNIQQLHSRG